MGRPVKDLRGEKFNRLRPVELTEHRTPKGRNAVWVCECQCGSGIKVYADSSSLRSGNVKSCGCLLQERRQDKWETFERRHDEEGGQ